jgi:hypothetical protein
MARKSKAKLDRLPEDQFDLLVDWLSVEGITYAAAVDRLLEEFAVETSPSALTNFYRKHCIGYKHKRARRLAKEVGKMFSESDSESFGAATIQAIEQRAFDLSMAKDADVDELATLAKILGDTRKLELQQRKLNHDERRIALLERKAAAFDKVNKTANAEGDGLTPQQRLAKIREEALI